MAGTTPRRSCSGRTVTAERNAPERWAERMAAIGMRACQTGQDFEEDEHQEDRRLPRHQLLRA